MYILEETATRLIAKDIKLINDLKKDHLIQYLEWRTVSPKTKKEELSALKAVCAWLFEEGILSKPPVTSWPEIWLSS